MKYRLVISATIILLAALVNYGLSRPESEIGRLPLNNFPLNIGRWTSMGEQVIDEKAMDLLRVDDYIMRNYINDTNEVMGLYIGYFKTQREGKQIHSPRQCLPGAGWTILNSKEFLLDVGEVASESAKINYYLMGKEDQKVLYLWWYQARGRVYANEYLNKIYMIWDAVTKNRTDGALVRVHVPVFHDDVDQALQKELAFIKLIHSELDKFIPE